MKATLIVIQNDAEHAEAKALVEKLMGASDPGDLARMTGFAVWRRSCCAAVGCRREVPYTEVVPAARG